MSAGAENLEVLQLKSFGEQIVRTNKPRTKAEFGESLAGLAAILMEQEDRQARIIHLRDRQTKPNLELFIHMRKFLGDQNLSAPLFDGGFNPAYDRPRPPIETKKFSSLTSAARIRLGHQIDPTKCFDPSDETEKNVLPYMVERWEELGCFVVLSSNRDHFTDLMPDSDQKPPALRTMLEQGRVLDTVIPILG